MNDIETLANAKCTAEYRPDAKEIVLHDLTDADNLPAAFSRSKRGIAKAWMAAKAEFAETTTMWQMLHILSAHNIKMHFYCMMD